MACKFHARLSISILHTSSFILEPNECLSPVGVSAYKSTTTSVHDGGVHEDGGRGEEWWQGSTHSFKDEKWQWVIAVRGTRSGVDGSSVMADELDNIIPFTCVWSKVRLFSSPSSTALHNTGGALMDLRGSVCNRKTPHQYILMTGDKWGSSPAGLFAVHESRQTADWGVC